MSRKPQIIWSGQAATKTLNWNHEWTRMNTNEESTEYTDYTEKRINASQIF